MITVVPVRLIRSSSSMMPSLVSGSRFPVGSSASSTSGRLTNARAMATRCCSPPESSPGRRCALPSSPTISSTSGTTRLIVRCGLLMTSSAKATFCATVRSRSRRKSWKTQPMVRRSLGTCHLLIVFSVLPLTTIVPEVGVSSLSSNRRNVDFPEPEDPMRKTNSPLSISVDTSSRAGRPLAGYSLVTCCNSITRRHGTCPSHDNAPFATERALLVLAQGDRRARMSWSSITDGGVRLPTGRSCDLPYAGLWQPATTPAGFLARHLSADGAPCRLPRPGPLLALRPGRLRGRSAPCSFLAAMLTPCRRPPRCDAPGAVSRRCPMPASAPRSAPRSFLAAMLPGLSAGVHGLLLPAPPDAGLDEGVDVAVEDRRRVPRLVLGPQVLDHLVRVQHVGTHLVAPAAALALEGVHLRLLLLLPDDEQARLEHPEGGRPVLDLALLVLAGHHDAGRDVRHPDGGVGGVDALPTGPRGAEDVHTDLVLGDVHVVGLLDDGQHLDPREGGLPPALVVERRDADEPVGALLDREGAVGVGHLDGEGGRLDARLLGVAHVVDLGRVLVPLGPAQVHPHQHLGPVGGVHTTGLRADGHQGLAGVVLPREQGPDLELVDDRADAVELTLGLRGRGLVALFLGHLVHEPDIVQPAAQLLDAAQGALQVGQPGGERLGGLDVVPEVRGGGLLLEVGDLAAHVVDPENGLDRLQGRVQFVQDDGEVSSHVLSG